MDLSKLLNWSYLLERYPIVGFSWTMRIILLIVFIGAIVIGIYAARKLTKSSGLFKKLWTKLQLWGWTIGLIGLALFFFREVRAIYLGARIWMLLWIIFAFIWLAFIIKYWKKEIPKKEEIKKTEEEFNRWLPKRK